MELHNIILQLIGVVASSAPAGANAGGPVTCIDIPGKLVAQQLSSYMIQIITPDLRALAEEINHFETNFVEKSGNESFLSKLNNVN